MKLKSWNYVQVNVEVVPGNKADAYTDDCVKWHPYPKNG